MIEEHYLKREDLQPTAATMWDQYVLAEETDGPAARRAAERAAGDLAAEGHPMLWRKIREAQRGGPPLDWAACAEDAAYLMAALDLGLSLGGLLDELVRIHVRMATDADGGAEFQAVLDRYSHRCSVKNRTREVSG